MKTKYLGKKDAFIPIPNLIENHINSYEKFQNVLIDEVMKEIFPIEDNSGNFILEYIDSVLEEPVISPETAKLKKLSYYGVLRANLRLINNETGEPIEQNTFWGEIPYMTEKGTFIHNGIERILVNQIVRSPGMYVTSSLTNQDKTLYEAKVIPSEGAWLTFETDAKDNLNVFLNVLNKKIPFTLFLKAVGKVTNEEIIATYGEDNIFVQNSFEKDTTQTIEEATIELFHLLRPDEPKMLERAEKHLESMFTNPRRYNLEPVGRYKLNHKLSFNERLLHKVLAEDVDGFKKGTMIDETFFEKVKASTVKVFNLNDEVVSVTRNEATDSKILTKQDLLAIVDYLMTINKDIGQVDNIDHLGNRRVRLAGELLQGKMRNGLARVEKNIKEKMNTSQVGVAENSAKMTPQNLINVRPLVAVLREFLGGNQLSQFVEQVNPFAELAHKRRISALGEGGFQKERAGLDVRDVHYSHYGRMCPSETPEGQNVGLITSLGVYARINEFGIIETPYVKVDKKKGKVTDEIVYMTADEEEKYYIAKTNSVDEDGYFKEDFVTARRKGEYPNIPKEEVDFIGVSPAQIVGTGIQLIPFIHHDDANRAVMGANMQRQAVPLIHPDKPIIGTGMESVIATNTGASYVAEDDGKVVAVTKTELVVEYKKLGRKTYKIRTYERTNADTSLTHRIKVTTGQKVKKGDVLSDSTSSEDGELALGKNVTVAFMTWFGYNYEDAIVINKDLVDEDAYTTIMIQEYSIDVSMTTTGMEELRSTGIPNVSKQSLIHLDEEGIVKIGATVSSGDVLVGKVSPKGTEDVTPEERLIRQIVTDKGKNLRDTSLKMPLGKGKKGVVVDVVRIKKDEAELNSGVQEHIKVFVAEKRKIKPGDKMAGRHGNKGVISIVVPPEDMPYMEDGTPIDIVLNPLGVPSRMNIGQIMETHLGMAGKKLATNYRIPAFQGNGAKDVEEALEEAGFNEHGKFTLYDGMTGEQFDNDVTVGVMYMLKLNHQVDDKMHARSTGRYSLVTQQPLGGKAQMGGQRFGEMEVWALEAHGAAFMLREMLTTKSDDIVGRTEQYEAIVVDREMNHTGKTESFKVMMKELQSLGLDVKLHEFNK